MEQIGQTTVYCISITLLVLKRSFKKLKNRKICGGLTHRSTYPGCVVIVTLKSSNFLVKSGVLYAIKHNQK